MNTNRFIKRILPYLKFAAVSYFQLYTERFCNQLWFATLNNSLYLRQNLQNYINSFWRQFFFATFHHFFFSSFHLKSTFKIHFIHSRNQESYLLYGSLLEHHYAIKNTNQKYKNINNTLKKYKKRTHNRVIVI